MDESERRQLELFAGLLNEEQRQELILKEFHFLLGRAKELAMELPAEDELVGQVLGLTTPLAVAEVQEEDDEGGTGEQETSTEGKEKKKVKVNSNSKRKQQAPPPAKQKQKPKSAQSPRQPAVVEKKRIKSQPQKAKTSAKEVVAVAVVQEEEVVLVEEEPSNGVCERDMLKLVEEAEREFVEIQNIAKGGGAAQMSLPDGRPSRCGAFDSQCSA
jgi:outer membrane biosynthesis protein TonB